ncbi:polyprenyl synthetase family protein [Tolypothrix sp. LEGE 11397]|uniref:polyprenyl synthetase family protein n=1 Tax=unclassified Tolypothrix TaxID=2649714 RepID=UPI000B6104BB|nr:MULTISPECIES: polyprenyl synthetase family protein [unclassified Tolypothrix]MBE9084891.1 polyprenyl synthetase family protein [Tolypothrix sp. LEGE 11397]UYD30600.1 polyprenyl synthetase family protein [Tolypothrix sp. PCC 7712]UYD38473.1 polyprenyl synthetase family protein [Tolypothrix sp. PCC 7601]BAY95497.1 glycosyl transferase family 28 [Microchaete diplosiphon NIES-3275]
MSYKFKYIFIGGLHNSGASFLEKLLTQHPQISALYQDNYGQTHKNKKYWQDIKVGIDITETEGQLVQNVYLPDEFFGGVGFWAFNPHAHLTASSSLVTEENRLQLLKQWGQYWSGSKPIKLERSASNILRSRFINAMLPQSYQIFILRHPIANAYATDKILDDTEIEIENLIRHWIYAHQVWQNDCQYISNYKIIYWEELLQNPQIILNEICQDLELDSHSIDFQYYNLPINKQEWENWELENEEIKKAILKWENLIRRFNYSLYSKEPLNLKSHSVKVTLAHNNESLNLIPSFIKKQNYICSQLNKGKIPKNLLFISFGTRGDIQPCIALGLGFQKSGYNVWICSTEEHRTLVESNHLSFVSLGVDHTSIVWEMNQVEEPELSGDSIYKFYQDIEKIINTLINCCQINSIDCLMIGIGFLLYNFVSDYLKIPYIQLKWWPFSIKQNTQCSPFEGYIKYYANVCYVHSNWKCYQIIQEVYNKLSIPLKATDNLSFNQQKQTLVLNGYTPLFPTQELPGLKSHTTGFWLLKPSKSLFIPEELENYLNAGSPPICLNFGSMDVYSQKTWIEPLLNAIRATGRRCISIGKYVPKTVKERTYWVDYVPHTLLFSKCCYVIHHGGSGTTAQCLLSGVPSVVIPVILWADQGMWGKWIDQEKAGIYLGSLKNYSANELNQKFTNILNEIESPIYRQNAERLGMQLEKEDGVNQAINIFENYFKDLSSIQYLSIEMMKKIENLQCSHRRKLELSIFVLLYESETLPKQTLQNRQQMVNEILETTKKYCIYQEEWPAKNKKLDVQKHDLPHISSKAEFWSFYIHLVSQKNNKKFVITTTLFQILVRNIQLHHIHCSFLDVPNQQYHTFSKGDSQGLKVIAEYLQPRYKSDYMQRALQEILKKGEYPLPDQKCKSIPQINQELMDYSIDEINIYKDELNNYHVDGKFENYSFNLQLQPIKEPIFNGKYGVIHNLQMFYYSLPRLQATGTVQIGQEVYSVEGLGWYDRKFGGVQENSRFKEHKYQWVWIAIQLENNAEIVYNPNLIDFQNSQDNSELNILFVSPEGETKYYQGNLRTTEFWTSSQTFIEYGISWVLSIESLKIKLYLKAEIPNQEIISIIAQPAYWKGSVQIEGTYENHHIKGIGFVEQVGFGCQYSNYKNYLRAVSKKALNAVDRCYPLNPSFEDIRRLIADEGFELFLEGVSQKSFIENLIQPVRTMTDRGGKAWRSLGLLLCIAAVGGDPHKFEDFLAFPELIHTGSLIVDDVEDNSSMRRGGETCHSIYGIPTAINAGTAAYFAPETLLKRSSISDKTLLEIYQLYFLFLRGGHVGQGLDIQGLQALVTECLATGYFQKVWHSMLAIHRLKSGLPASIAARIGVLLGEGTSKQKEILGEYFLAIGVAFQIMDDVINLRGFCSGLKTKGEDLIEGKITAPVIQGFLTLNPQKILKLWQGLEKGASAEDLPMLIELLEECGAMDNCINYAKNLVENAWLKVDQIIPESYAKLQLRMFGWFVVEIRDY